MSYRRQDESDDTAEPNPLHALLSVFIGLQRRSDAASGSQQEPSLIPISPEDLRRHFAAMEGVEGEYEDEDEGEGSEVSEDDDDEPEDLFPDAEPHDKSHDEVTEPKEEGLALIYSGEFGRVRHQVRSGGKDNSIARSLLRRGTRTQSTYREDLTCDLVPNSSGTAVASYRANAYVGQYSSGKLCYSSFYYTCVRDFRLHIYDTRTPSAYTGPNGPTRYREGSHETSMTVIKSIRAYADGWTITDSHLSPDNQRMIYATVSNNVYMTSTLDTSPETSVIDFSDRVPRRRGRGDHYYQDDYEDFGIWSCKFSADGNEVVAGGRKMIFVYDLLADKRTVKIKGHANDINSCCWADTASGNVLVSASDDTFLKVWDRRSLGSAQTPSGVLIGHTEGITYVSAKGDGRYVISNGKDQKLRLWDLRKMRSNLDFEQVKGRNYGIREFDYRTESYPRPRYKAHPNDCSVMEYTGHEVLRTLIRCHFSPAETTGGQYIYSGSADGRIHIWSLDGRVVQVLDRSGTLPMSFDPSGPEPAATTGVRRRVCVRDVSWHSQQPILMSAGWMGSGWGAREASVIARHEWKGLSKMNHALEDYVEKQKAELSSRDGRNLGRISYRMPGFLLVDSDDM